MMIRYLLMFTAIISGLSTLITDGSCRTKRNYGTSYNSSFSNINTKPVDESRTTAWETYVPQDQDLKILDNIIGKAEMNETQQNKFNLPNNNTYYTQDNNTQDELQQYLNANYTSRYDYNNTNKNNNDDFIQFNPQYHNPQDRLQYDLNSTIPTPPPPPAFPVFDPSKQIVKSNQNSNETVIEKNYNEEKPAMSMADQIFAQWEKMQRKREEKRLLQENIDDTDIKPVTPAKQETQMEAMRRQLEERMKQMNISKNNNTKPINNGLQQKSDNNNKVQSSNVKQKEQLEKLNNIYNNMMKSISELKELSTNIIKNQ